MKGLCDGSGPICSGFFEGNVGHFEEEVRKAGERKRAISDTLKNNLTLTEAFPDETLKAKIQ
jgi:hypothetical protein